MKAIANFAECPRCSGGHKSRPYCLYENGWHCFSCGYNKAADRGFSFHDRRPSFPEWPDAIATYTKFSLEAQMWLAKCGVTEELVYKYRIHYTDDGCVLFPHFDENNVLVCYQKRKVSERHITTYGVKTPYLLKSGEDGEVLVIVEDFLSAIKVCEAGYDTLCLWGTKLAYEEIKAKFKYYDTILVWLDNDKEKPTNSGQEAAKKILAMGRSILNNKYGFSSKHKNVVNIVTDTDPKWYNPNEIESYVKGALHEQSRNLG